ncbi:MAG: glycosyltransferase, partial [Marmoricola sp.]|nr:glycosyltransferase [Marmoricola sp.]
MSRVERPKQAARAVVRQLPRARRVGRRYLRKAQRRVAHHGAALTVVVPVYNVREWIRPALESLLAQTLTDLEIIVVDDGSTDGSIDIVAEYAENDGRIRIIHQENAGLGAARNAGARHATGAFIAFFDSDDLVMPDAYRAMVESLRASGSDFVTAAFARGDETLARKPDWVNRTMGRNRAGIRLADEPDLLLDITAWNKVFRTAFWRKHDFQFVEGVRYEDQVPITRAYLTARALDVLRQRVYVWRVRLDGSSITQQKTSIVDLTDRLLSQEGCARLMRKAPALIRETWYRKLLGYDLPSYLVAAINADEEYVALLQTRLDHLKREIPDAVWHQIAFRERITSWVMSHGHLELGAELRGWFEREPGGLPTRTESTVTSFVLPFEADDEVLPEWLRRVYPVDVRPIVRLVETRWDDDVLVLRGSAYLTPLPRELAPQFVTLRLLAASGTVEVPVSRFSDPALRPPSMLAHQDVTDSGFEARIDVPALLAAAPGGQETYRLEVVQHHGEFTRTSDITHVVNTGSGGDRQPREIDGHLVRLAGVVDTGHRIQVSRTYAMLVDHLSAGADEVELVVASSPHDPVVGAVVSGSTDPLTTSAMGEGRSVVRVRRGQDGRLRARHASGREVQVLWCAEPGVIGSSAGAFVRRGPSLSVVVGALGPAVLVSHVSIGDDALEVRGTSLGSAGRHLVLHGPRADSTVSPALPEGHFETRVPLTRDLWGFRSAPLPRGSYELTLQQSAGAALLGGENRVQAVTSLRQGWPVVRHVSGQHLELGLTHTANVVAKSSALSADEASAWTQVRLRHDAYAEARSSAPLPTVLLETFGGAALGDSPLAIAQELRRRYPDLDVAATVMDASLTPPEGIRPVVRFGAEWYELLGRAALLINNNNFPYFFSKSPEQVYVQTWHGTPLKRIG